MIYPLRRRHRAMIFVLAILVPALFIVSLLSRPVPQDPNSEIPSTFTPISDAYEPVAEKEGVFDAQPAMAYQLLSHQSGNGLAVGLSTTEALRIPELLVYWSPQAAGEALPEERELLGSWAVTSSRVFALPERVQEFTGSIVLYSLSQQQVVASTPLH